ncbi:hypothetical protein BCR41DRAFT_201742 [Lobosporangium transversale]|uniref:Uncharacterized protein n=1 Tax=Lobosporangium transversale TaxID=64571 RepID=A0A1Y2GW84_9FUNG|nr:hypothetical protein BCR41DRAFT_201742 [Lobosporangium transversale]ORZ26570.1 hypothetical protein BCR41DRAFT_201742 [Lobosporangium transversale]|eukprot:XP_021884333.1 hypothetical protein BCR41DRAFT_201742 [Lobosporangium transversale]
MQMPSIRQIRQRQSDKYKEGKMAAIRYTRLFLFRNIRLVESKYIKYAQTKSRSYQETVSRSWLMRARQRRKRNLESVVEDLRTTAQEKEDEKFRKMREEHSIDSSIADDDSSDPSVSVGVEERSTVSELDADDTIIYPGEGGKGNTNREDEKLSEDVAEDENYEIKDEDTDGSEQLDHDNIVSLGEETVYGDLW